MRRKTIFKDFSFIILFIFSTLTYVVVCVCVYVYGVLEKVEEKKETTLNESIRYLKNMKERGN